MNALTNPLQRAWIEIDLGRLRRNFAIINAAKSAHVHIASVLKDDAYGHGAPETAREALAAGAQYLALVTVDEAVALRAQGIAAPILLLGGRLPGELPACLEHNLTVCLHGPETLRALACLAAAQSRRAPVHVKIDTGMSRYGVRWTEAAAFIAEAARTPGLELQGVMSHFAMSDELDKSFANLQRARFQSVLDQMAAQGVRVRWRHLCNSGGLLDLPEAHYDMVRLGLLPLGVYPSKVCRRLDGLQPVMSVKTRVVHIQNLEPGDCVGYGMRYTAPSKRRIAVLPVGYGDGFPRVRNQGQVLIHGLRAPLVGGVSMDAITVDITEIPAAQLWDEAVIMGCQGSDEISVHEVAALKNSVSYDVLVGWRARLRRVYLDAAHP